jgi:broad specificity phosphatase PhoE
MARLHLLRHGETDWNAEQRWQGHSDRPLNDLGREQAAAVAPAVAALKPVAIHASDMIRAIDTAEPAAELCGLEIIVDASLREIDTGSWTGRGRSEILAAEPGAVGRHEGGETAWEGGETFAELQDRVVEALERVAGAYASHDVVAVFAHGGVIRAAVAHAAGGEWRDARRGVAPLIHGSLTVVNVPGWRLECFNVPLVVAHTAGETA